MSAFLTADFRFKISGYTYFCPGTISEQHGFPSRNWPLFLTCLVYGARKGGVALGLLSGIGLVILVFVFQLSPGKPPVDVILTIIAVVAASATLQASGGLEVVLRGVENSCGAIRNSYRCWRLVRRCGLTMICGTGHVVYTMLPIIYDVAIRNGIRPERPMAASAIASQMGIIASPVSVAMVSLAAFLAAIPEARQWISLPCCQLRSPQHWSAY